MMLPNHRLSRRTVLKGLGTAVALPLLDAMLPRLAVAGLSTAKKDLPVRLGVVYVPNGVNMVDWTPAGEGPLTKLPYILEPLAPVKDDLLVISGLTCDKARSHGDGPGDHARAMSAFLTGSQPRKTYGADIKAGVSFDQFLAQRIGEATKFPSLELGCESARGVGNCDSGYSCAYSSTVSWRTETTPVPKEINPALVFDRLFGTGKADDLVARQRRREYRQSILDMVRDDARSLEGSLGAADNRKLDEYLSAVRELEVRIAKARSTADKPGPRPDYPHPPAGVPKDYAEHVKLMGDLLVLAFQTDTTRVGTLVYANEGSTRPYPFLGVPEGHHDLSHHQRDSKKLEKIRTINRFHMASFAAMMEKLKGIKEGDGTLLDRCLFVYGSGNSDGNRHNHDDLPILVVGKGGGAVKGGRHLLFPRDRDTPLCNLYLSMAERFGVDVAHFGDSTGKLPRLTG
jgi:Protein of unknown function (DUF1552)